MPFDFERKRRETGDASKRIYVCDCGDICVETRYSRRSFSPEEFVAILRQIIIRQQKISLKTIGGLILAAVCFLMPAGCGGSDTASGAPGGEERIVSVGGAATEIVYALEAGDKLVGTDTSSVFPEAATRLPQVGYQRTLSAEGVLSLKPTLVILSPEAGPPTAIEQLENAGVKILRVNNESTPEGAKTKIRRIAEALNRKEKGEELVRRLESEMAEAERLVAEKQTRPRVVFIYSRGAGSAHVGGTGTPADAMIKMAGGENAVTEFSEYKPLTPEALAAARPDVILVPARSLDSFGGVEALLNLPGVAQTPAGKNRKIVAIDDMLLLGFTPRLGQGVKELCEKIH